MPPIKPEMFPTQPWRVAIFSQPQRRTISFGTARMNAPATAPGLHPFLAAVA
jgi:hypothetical protein